MPINAEVASHIEIEFGDYGRRALDFLRSAHDLLLVGIEIPKKGELVAYSIREALKSLLDVQAPAVRRRRGNETGWAERSRAVVSANERWKMAAGGEEKDDAASQLTSAIGEMAALHEEDGLNVKRLIAVLLDRTGSVPFGDGVRRVEEFRGLLTATNGALHSQVSVDEAAGYWRRSVHLLETLFMPPTLRNERLQTLARLDAPTGEDLAALRQLIVVPGYLETFLGLLEGPEWLELLETSGLLDPPNTQTWWAGHTLVRTLKDTHQEELLGVLEELFQTSAKQQQSVYSLAWSAYELGPSARPLLLNCLRAFPDVVSYLAVAAAADGDPSDVFVEAVGDIVLNPGVLATEQYVDPLLDALSAGVSEANFSARITLLVQKARAAGRDDKNAWSLFALERGLSVGDKRHHGKGSTALDLIHTLTRILDAALTFTSLRNLLDLVTDLPDEPRGRIRPWLVARHQSASTEDLLVELELGINSRLPSVDDISLAERLQVDLDVDQLTSKLAIVLGAPPSLAEVTAALSSNDLPAIWLYRYGWSPLFSPVALGRWAKAIEQIAGRYGAPSKARIRARVFGEFTAAESPIPANELVNKSRPELLVTLAQWRPGPGDWLNSANELAAAMTEIMRADVPGWAESPVRTATGLVHPTYISRYVRMLSDELEKFEPDVPALVGLIGLVFDEPWPVERIGESGQFDYDDTWLPAQRSAIALITALANSGLDLEDAVEPLLGRLAPLIVNRGADSERPGVEEDPFQRALNTLPGVAFEALLALAGWDYRSHGSVRWAIEELFNSVLLLRGSTAEEHRALLATRLPFLNTIVPNWLAAAFPVLFAPEGDSALAQSTLDVFVRWSSPSKRVFEESRDGLWDAVRRNVPHARTKILIAMLWEVEGYSREELVSRLAGLEQLSAAADDLGTLLSNSADVSEELVAAAANFWRQALASNTREPLVGFGAFASVQQISDEELADLLRATLESMDEPLENSYQVSKRLAEATPSEQVLSVFDLMVRRPSHSFEYRMTTGAAVQFLRRADALSDTAAYQRLRNALQERRLL